MFRADHGPDHGRGRRRSISGFFRRALRGTDGRVVFRQLARRNHVPEPFAILELPEARNGHLDRDLASHCKVIGVAAYHRFRLGVVVGVRDRTLVAASVFLLLGGKEDVLAVLGYERFRQPELAVDKELVELSDARLQRLVDIWRGLFEEVARLLLGQSRREENQPGSKCDSIGFGHD